MPAKDPRDPRVLAAKRRHYEKKKAERTAPPPITEARKAAVKRYATSEKGRAAVAARRKQRALENPEHAIYLAVRRRITNLFHGGRPLRTAEGLGCTYEELLGCMAKHPNWQPSWTAHNVGSVWQLDHTRALGLFDLTDPQQYAIALHYTNLQPLAVEEHKAKTKEDIRLMRWFKKAGDYDA